jgi:hypothetical protein
MATHRAKLSSAWLRDHIRQHSGAMTVSRDYVID